MTISMYWLEEDRETVSTEGDKKMDDCCKERAQGVTIQTNYNHPDESANPIIYTLPSVSELFLEKERKASEHVPLGSQNGTGAFLANPMCILPRLPTFSISRGA